MLFPKLELFVFIFKPNVLYAGPGLQSRSLTKTLREVKGIEKAGEVVYIDI